MRQLLALILMSTPAAAQMVGYNGPPALRSKAQDAFEALKVSCPRLEEAAQDLAKYSLYADTSGGKTIYADLARKMGADAIVLVTISIAFRPKVMPRSAIPADGATNLLMFTDGAMSGVVLRDKAAYWICDTAPEPGAPLALKPARGVGMALTR